MEQPVVEEWFDPTVDKEQDWQLRVLLKLCFDDMFRDKRYNWTLPRYRWVIRGPHGTLAAHAAAHEMMIKAGDEWLPVGGVAEVSVHPDFRRRGYLDLLFEPMHAWMQSAGLLYSTLLGRTEVYRGRGYRNVSNPFHYYDLDEGRGWVVEPINYFMVREMTDRSWPEGEVDLRGPQF